MFEIPTIDFQEVSRRLRARGMRLTGLKRATLAELAESELPLSADELVQRLEGTEDPSPIYRCLASLEEAGIVCHLYLGETPRRWALSENLGGHHDYLVCEECASVEVLADCALGDAVVQRVSDRGFTLLDHQVILTGICPTCAGSAEVKAPGTAD